MSDRRIEIVISPTGETKIETKGFRGKACKDATKALEAALGLTTSDTPTAEARLPEQGTDRLRQGQ